MLPVLAAHSAAWRARLCLAIFLSKLDSNVVFADGEATILALIGARRVGGLDELDEGEALDGAKVWAVLISVLGDVDVANGAILLKHGAELLDVDVAWQVACDDGQTAERDGRGRYCVAYRRLFVDRSM